MFNNQYLETSSLPGLESVEYESLAPNAPWEGFWSAFVWNMLILLMALITLSFNNVLQNKFALVGLALFVGLAVYNIWYVFACHKYKGLVLRKHDVLFKKGMFWRKTTIVPFNRIQHLETHRNPIERHLSLASLKLYTAGGMGADLSINGLQVERAEKIKEYILTKAGLSLKGEHDER